MSNSTTKPRIDKLSPGSVVELALFTGSKYEHVQKAMFMSLKGEGDTRRASFLFRSGSGDTYEVDLYRYHGRWAWGSSADRVSLDSVVTTAADLLA
jgi:hypothetical protein